MNTHNLSSGWIRKLKLPLIVFGIAGMLAIQNAQANPQAVLYADSPHNDNFDPAPVIFLTITAFVVIVSIFSFHHYARYHRVHYIVVRRPAPVMVQTVPAPASDAAQPTAEPQTKTFMVQNTNGSQTPVLLKLVDGKWQGPRGEVYDAYPTNDQLRSVYGF